MSNSFDGKIVEFPDIQVDLFSWDQAVRPPLACFLSHAHDDHLQGLNSSYNGPFIYCSEVTKQLVLRLVSRPNLVRQQTDSSLALRKYPLNSKLLRPLSFDVAHMLQIGNSKISVTLIDANHCIGSCMFLFQNASGDAVLYTGDMRAEPIFVNNLVNNPVFLPFIEDGSKRLTSIYADTTFAYRGRPYLTMPSNSQGIRTLVSLLRLYPPNAVFFFNTMTIGYEKGILQVASSIGEKVHVDSYSYLLIQTAARHDTICRLLLAYLTKDPLEARFHFCKKAAGCASRHDRGTVFLTPVINKSVEVVAEQNSPLHLKFNEHYDIVKADINIEGKDGEKQHPNIFIHQERRFVQGKHHDTLLPCNVQFHFSRHSSYEELCNFIGIFKPLSVYPCVETSETKSDPQFLMRTLFGHVCAHDQEHRFDKEKHKQQGTSTKGSVLKGRGQFRSVPVKKRKAELDSQDSSSSDSISSEQILAFLSRSRSQTPAAAAIDDFSPSNSQALLGDSQLNNVVPSSDNDSSDRRAVTRSSKRPHLVRSGKALKDGIKNYSNVLSSCRINDTIALVSNDKEFWFDVKLDFVKQ